MQTTKVIFSGDKEPRILKVLSNVTEEKAWEIANLMSTAPACDFEHYDILSFNNIEEAINFFIREGRKYQRDFNLEIL